MPYPYIFCKSNRATYCGRDKLSTLNGFMGNELMRICIRVVVVVGRVDMVDNLFLLGNSCVLWR